MKKIVTLIFFFWSSWLLACPGCIGSMDNPKDNYIVAILAGFIVLTYIPFYIIYKTIIKNRHLNAGITTTPNSVNHDQ